MDDNIYIPKNAQSDEEDEITPEFLFQQLQRLCKQPSSKKAETYRILYGGKPEKGRRNNETNT